MNYVLITFCLLQAVANEASPPLIDGRIDLLVEQPDCKSEGGGEIVVCGARQAESAYRYREIEPPPGNDGAGGPLSIRLPGGASIQGLKLVIPF